MLAFQILRQTHLKSVCRLPTDFFFAQHNVQNAISYISSNQFTTGLIPHLKMLVADLMYIRDTAATETCREGCLNAVPCSQDSIHNLHPLNFNNVPPKKNTHKKKQGNQTTKSFSNPSFDLFRSFQLRCRMVAPESRFNYVPPFQVIFLKIAPIQ